MPLHRTFHFRSDWETIMDIPEYLPPDDPRRSRFELGGYTFPVLDELPSPYEVEFFDPPHNHAELEELVEQVRSKGVILAYVDSNQSSTKLVVVKSESNLSSIGLKIWARDNGASKTVKRAKTISRLFRIHACYRYLRVAVIEGGAELDGGGIVAPWLYEEAKMNLHSSFWNPTQRGVLIRRFDHDKIHNSRFMGNLIDAYTGEPLHAFAKGNFMVADLPEGIDIMTTTDNLKWEVTADPENENSRAWALFEPQGSKDAWEDQQTLVNHPFLISIPEARKRMEDEATKALKDLKDNKIMASVIDLSKPDFSRDLSWTDERLLNVAWNAERWSMHGLDPQFSPWLTERLGAAWVASLGIGKPRRLRLRIPCAIRAQVISNSLASLAGEEFIVERGTLRWSEKYKVAVANDEDWREIIISSHGGCDLDDFFVIRWRLVNGKRKMIVTRSPNTRGEFTVWDYVEDDWFPTYEDGEGNEVIFPPITKKRWPKQILDAKIEYLALPSETNPPELGDKRGYCPQDVIDALASVMDIKGGYGQYELAVRAFHSIHPTMMDTEQIKSESAVDAFTQGGTIADRMFVLADRDRIIGKIRSSGKPVDTILAARLGVANLPVTSNGLVSRLKNIMAMEAVMYNSKVEEFCASLEIPPWLEFLAKNRYLHYATRILKSARREMYLVDQSLQSLKQEDRARAMRRETDNILQPYWDEITQRSEKAQLTMAFWYACLTVPTTGDRISDQPVFGTMVFDLLLDALVYYGIAGEPVVNDDGHLTRRYRVRHNIEAQSFDVTCAKCHETYRGLEVTHLSLFWDNDCICKTCRPSKEEQCSESEPFSTDTAEESSEDIPTATSESRPSEPTG